MIRRRPKGPAGPPSPSLPLVAGAAGRRADAAPTRPGGRAATSRRRTGSNSIRRLASGALRRAKAAGSLAATIAAAAAGRMLGKAGRPDVLLHAGEHKTGTTSLQSLLLAEREALARQGFHVLRAGQGADGAHHRLIYTLLGQFRSRAIPALLRAELAQAAPRAVLISSETVKKAVVEGEGSRVIDALRAAGAGRVRLLLYLRSPFGLASSSYSSHTSRLELEGATFGDFVRAQEEGPAYRYERFLELARRDDVDLVVRPYSEAARSSIGLDFAGAIGVELPIASEPRLNTSYGPVGLEAMRIMAEETSPLPDEVRKRLFAALRPVARSLGEQPFWGIDESVETALATADRRAEAFAMTVWGRGWREVVGEERRPLNVFDPSDRHQGALLETALGQMRKIASEVLT